MRTVAVASIGRRLQESVALGLVVAALTAYPGAAMAGHSHVGGGGAPTSTFWGETFRGPVANPRPTAQAPGRAQAQRRSTPGSTFWGETFRGPVANPGRDRS
jgi:hypothetical protein